MPKVTDNWTRGSVGRHTINHSLFSFHSTVKKDCCEQSLLCGRLAWNKSIYLNFLRLWQCAQRRSLGNLAVICLPSKIINCFYTGSRSTVRVNGSLGKWFEVVLGVWQGCVLSSLLFIALNWVMRQAEKTASGSGLKWTLGDNLTDLDFADDIVLIDERATTVNRCSS